MIVFLLVFLGCQEPDPCAAMCSIATRHLGGCMESEGLGWQDAGYADAREFFHSCETWAWASRKLEDDAGATGATTQTCESWHDKIQAPTFSCEDFEDLDWNASPW